MKDCCKVEERRLCLPPESLNNLTSDCSFLKEIPYIILDLGWRGYAKVFPDDIQEVPEVLF